MASGNKDKENVGSEVKIEIDDVDHNKIANLNETGVAGSISHYFQLTSNEKIKSPQQNSNPGIVTF